MRTWKRNLVLFTLFAATISLAILPGYVPNVEPRIRFALVAGIFLCAVVVYFTQRWITRDETQATNTPSLRGRQLLIAKVLEFAEAQFDGGLYKKARKEFHLAERPLQVTTQENHQPLPSGGIERYYRSLEGPLVILGEPGTGKSTLLYELTTLLLPKDDDGASIPVPFELSAWAARQLPLEEFLAAELVRHYGVSGSWAKRWVADEVVLPMLDGLDEVPAAHRVACVTCINAFRKAHPRVKLVLACREAEYGELGLAVEARSAVVVQTLDRPAVEDYLAKSDFFDGLRKALAVAPELWDLMTTPLMLWVAAYAFERDGAEDLGSGTDVRAKLFNRFVDRMLARDAQKRPEAEPAFSPEETRRWLCETAAAMGRVGVTSFHLEDLSIDWLPASKRTAATLQLRWVSGLVGRFDSSFVKRPVDEVTWSWLQFKNVLVGGLDVGLVGGLIGGLIGGLLFGLLHGLVVGLLGGLVVGLVVGLLGGLAVGLLGGLVTNSVSQRSAANSGIKKSGLYAVRHLLFILIPSLWLLLRARRLAAEASFFLELSVLIQLFALKASLVGLLLTWEHGGAFCVQNLTLRFLLARGGYTPWRYTTFLHHAVERVIMIRQGGSFRFLHRMIQEHLAAGAASAQASPSIT